MVELHTRLSDIVYTTLMFDLTGWRITYRKKGQQNYKVKHFPYMCDQGSYARGFGGPSPPKIQLFIGI